MFEPECNTTIENNLDKINWSCICLNPNAIDIIKDNLDKVNWYYLAQNPNANHLLFQYDYKAMKENNRGFFEELVKYVFHPVRLINMSELYSMDLYDYTDAS